MAALPLSILVILIALYSFQLSPATAEEVGGWKPIKNLTDPEVVRVAKFAVKEHIIPNDLELIFVRIIKGEIQVVNGLKYKLVIEGHYTQKGPNNFEAVVYEKAGTKTLKLISFKKLITEDN